MNRGFAFISILITICAVTAYAQQGDGLILSHVMKQGETVTYKITQQLTGTRMLPGAAQATQIDCVLTSTVRMRLVKALDKGNMELAAETESVTVKLAGKEPRNMPGSKDPRIYRISPSGRPVEVVKGGKMEASPVTRSLLDAAWLESLVILAVFPETAVKTGSDWTHEIANPLQTDAKTKISAKLEDLKQAKEGRVATIKETIAMPEGQVRDEDPNASSSLMEGPITLKYLTDKGRLLAAEGNIKADVRTLVGVPGLPKGDVPMGAAVAMRVEQLNSKFTVETIPSAR
jgi:hypothetical protein